MENQMLNVPHYQTCSQCIKKQEGIWELKEEMIRLQVLYQKEKEKCVKLIHEKQYSFQENNYQRWRDNFINKEITKAYSKKKSQKEIQLTKTILKHSNKPSIQQSDQIVKISKHYEFRIQAIQTQKGKLLEIIKQLNEKVKQKTNICKTMMAKIHFLQLQNNQQNQLSIFNKCNQAIKSVQFKDREIQVNFGRDITYIICVKLRDQLILEFSEVFCKSFDLARNHPSIQIFKNNLKMIDCVRIRPYCQCLIQLLSANKDVPCNNLNKKQKWIIDSFQSIKPDKKQKQNGNLVYLFRLSSLFYRIQYSIQGNEWAISDGIMSKIKNELFNAYYQYLLN